MSIYHVPANSRLDQLCKLISKTQEDIQGHQQATRKVEESKSRAQKLHTQIGLLEKAVATQNKDSKKLENSSSLEDFIFYSLCNFNGQTKNERMDQLQKEKLVNEDKLTASREEMDNLEEEIKVLAHDAALLPSAQRNFDELFAEKKAMILGSSSNSSDSTVKTTLRATCQKRAQLEHDIVLLEAAVRTGYPALANLRIVRSYLSSAANWGTVDMMGGGMMVTMAKRNAIDQAKSAAKDAKNRMEEFSRALDSLGKELQHNLDDMSGFSAFADYFMDGIFIDWHVQSQINKASGSCSAAIAKVSNILRETESRLARMRGDVVQCDEEQRALVLSFGQSPLLQ